MSDIDASTNGPIIIVSGPGGVGKTTVSRLVAAAFDRSVHLNTADLMASVVSGWVDPNSPEADRQNEAIGAALAMSDSAAGLLIRRHVMDDRTMRRQRSPNCVVKDDLLAPDVSGVAVG